MQWHHGLPEEDGVFDPLGTGVLPPRGLEGRPVDPHTTPGAVHTTVAVVAYPRISNLDEFQPLKNVPGLRLQWVRSPADVAGLRPTTGSCCPVQSHRRRPGLAARAGLDQSIAAHAGQGGTVLGVCGGLQMLGEALIDPEGIDGNAPAWACCPWSPCSSLPRPCSAPAQPSGRSRAWARVGVAACGYEIHHGQTAQHPAMAAKGRRGARGHARHRLAEPGGQCAGRTCMACSGRRRVARAAPAQAPRSIPCSTAWLRAGLHFDPCWTR